MSILKSTKTGYKYQKWREDLQYFAERAIQLSQPFHKVRTVREVRFVIPKYSSTGVLGYEENWFKYFTDWTIDEFKEKFIQVLKFKIQGTEFELEDIEIPKVHIIE